MRLGRRAALAAGAAAVALPFLDRVDASAGAGRRGAAAPVPTVGPNGLRVRPPSARWVEHGRTARAAGVDRSVPCGSMRVLWGATTTEPLVALTFDDGPSAEYTGRVLDVLAEAGAVATFFVVGEQVRRFPGLVRRQVDEGHEVGNHTDRHDDLAVLDQPATAATLERADDAIAAATGGLRPRLLRPPYGHVSGATLAAAGVLGYDVALWTVGLDEVNLTPQENVEHVVAGSRPGAVVLAHDKGDARRAVGLAALPGILAGLRDAGYGFATVSELIASEGAAVPA